MSNIIINDVNPYSQYIASAAQTIFAYPFPVFNEQDISVYQTPDGTPPDDPNQKLILNVDYTVQDVGDETGGTITLLVGATLNDRITIRRDMLYQRTSNYVNFTDFDVEEFNVDFQRLWMMGQQNRMVVEKFLAKYQNSILFDDENLQLPPLEANHIWKRNVAGIVSVELEEDPGATTLRSELANDQAGTDGARLVGFYDPILGGITVHDALLQSKIGIGGVDTGAANVYGVTLSPAPSALADIAYRPIQVRIANPNSGASTLDVNSLGVKDVKMAYQGFIVDPPSLALIAGMMAQFVYDPVADDFKLMNPDRLADFKTGWVFLTYETNAQIPSGWIALDDGTIGSAGSGATTRANADTEALYTLLWENVSQPSGDVDCPVTGGIGASALADFSANKSLLLPLWKGRVVGRFGQQSDDPTYSPTMGSVVGSKEHTMTLPETVAHTHGVQFGNNAGFNSTHIAGKDGSISFSGTQLSLSAGGGLPHNNLEPSTYANAMIKL